MDSDKLNLPPSELALILQNHSDVSVTIVIYVVHLSRSLWLLNCLST